MKKADNKNPFAQLASLIARAFNPAAMEEFGAIAAQDRAVSLGRKQAARGDQAGALQSFMSFYNRRSTIGHLIRRRNSHVIFDLLKLSDTYEEAKNTVILLSKEMEDEIRRQDASDEDISDWCSIVRHLGESDRAWELYNELLQKNASSAPKVAGVVYARLVDNKRYTEALPTAIENALWTIEEVSPRPKAADDVALLYTYWLPSVYESYEVLLACDDQEHLQSLQQWIAKIENRDPVYDGLIKAALKADKPEIAETIGRQKLQTEAQKPL